MAQRWLPTYVGGPATGVGEGDGEDGEVGGAGAHPHVRAATTVSRMRAITSGALDGPFASPSRTLPGQGRQALQFAKTNAACANQHRPRVGGLEGNNTPF